MKLLKLSGLTIAVLAVVGCKQEAPQQPQRPPQAVSYITIKAQPVKIQAELQGRLSSVEEAEVRPQITGIIQEIKVKDGQTVKKGEILYKVDPAQYQATYNQAMAAYDSINADLETAKLKHERYSKLSTNKAISIQEADDAKSAYNKLVATLAERKAALDIAKINLTYTEIKAPIDGKLGISTITPGALVTANQSASINSITRLNPINLDVNQASKEFMGMMAFHKELKSQEIPVEFKFDKNSSVIYSGKISSNELKVNPDTDSIKVRALFNNDDFTLLPGMFGYATITYGVREDGIQIPMRTILRDAKGQASVYVIKEGNKVEQVNIDVLQNSGFNSIINSGLNVGDKVVFDGIDKVRAGAEVTPTEISTAIKDVATSVAPSDSKDSEVKN